MKEQVSNDKSEIPISIEDIRKLVEKRVQEEDELIRKHEQEKFELRKKRRQVVRNQRKLFSNKKEIDLKSVFDDQYTEVFFKKEFFEDIKDITKEAFYYHWCPFVGNLEPLYCGIKELKNEEGLLLDSAYEAFKEARNLLFKITSTDLARQLELFYCPFADHKRTPYLTTMVSDYEMLKCRNDFPDSKYIEDVFGFPKGILDIYRKLYRQFDILMNTEDGKDFLHRNAFWFFKSITDDFDFNKAISFAKDSFAKNQAVLDSLEFGDELEHSDYFQYEDDMVFATSIEWVNQDMIKLGRLITLKEVNLVLSMVFILSVMRDVFVNGKPFHNIPGTSYNIAEEYIKCIIERESLTGDVLYTKKKIRGIINDKNQESERKREAKTAYHLENTIPRTDAKDKLLVEIVKLFLLKELKSNTGETIVQDRTKPYTHKDNDSLFAIDLHKFLEKIKKNPILINTEDKTVFNKLNYTTGTLRKKLPKLKKTLSEFLNYEIPKTL